MDWIKIDKSDAEVANVAREQARVRASVGTGSLFLFLALYLWNDGLNAHNTASSLAIALMYFTYNLVPLWLSRRFSLMGPRTLINLTVALDPLMLSAALEPLQGAGQLIFFFYLFTILGYGFRLGERAMLVCQAFAVLGFATISMSTVGWRDQPMVLWSHMVLLLVVPAYARLLVDKLHSALALAERESRAKSRLLAHVSHELRTPLTGIISSAQLIKEDTTDFAIAGRCETILGLAGELMVEINDLLDSAKYEAHALVLESAPFELRAVMDQVQLSLAATAALKDVQLHVSVDPLVFGSVLGDRHFLAKILLNLGANAVRFTERGMVELRIRLIEEVPGAYYLRFSCRDTGVGIPPEWQSKIFVPFTQAPGGNQRGVGGTGLGMSISKQLVQLMGGELKVESEVGKGTLFHFDLRMERSGRSRLDDAPPTVAEIVRGRSILLAEDNLTLRRLLGEILERDQHRVGMAASGQQALAMAQRQHYDLLLMDYNLGDMNGVTVLEKLRESAPAMPAYILTADATEATQHSAIAAGALGVLHKPVTREDLRSAIAAALLGPHDTPQDGPRAAGGTMPAGTSTHTSVGASHTGRAPASQDGSGALASSATATRSTPIAVPAAHLSAQPEPQVGAVLTLDPEAIARLKDINDDPAFLLEVLESAQRSLQENGDKLLQALMHMQLKDIRDHAHLLEGMCLSVGLTAAGQVTGTLSRIGEERLGRECDMWRAHLAGCIETGVAAVRQLTVSLRTGSLK